MNIGFLGIGGIGQAIAAHISKAGYEVIVSNSRGPESLSAVVRELGPRARAGTKQQAAAADVVVVAVQWQQVSAALADLPPWNGRILIDTTNAMGPGFVQLDLGGSTSSEIVAAMARGAHVVKIANTLQRALLASDPNQAGGHRVLFMSGDDAAAKEIVSEIFGKAGFTTIDLGALAAGGRLQQPGGPLSAHNLIEVT